MEEGVRGANGNGKNTIKISYISIYIDIYKYIYTYIEFTNLVAVEYRLCSQTPCSDLFLLLTNHIIVGTLLKYAKIYSHVIPTAMS